MGHLLVWSAIILVNSDNDVSPFAIFLIFFGRWLILVWQFGVGGSWVALPIAQTDSTSISSQCAFLKLDFFGRDRRRTTNPTATFILMPFVSAPQILGVLFWNNFLATVFCTICVSFLFVATYLIGINIAKNSRLTAR